MTPEDHEKRIEAARDAIYAEWSRSGDPRATWSDLPRVALDAADRAVTTPGLFDTLTPKQREALERIVYDWIDEDFATPPYPDAYYDIFEALGIRGRRS